MKWMGYVECSMHMTWETYVKFWWENCMGKEHVWGLLMGILKIGRWGVDCTSDRPWWAGKWTDMLHKRQGKGTRGWVEVWLYSSMTTALEGDDWSAARPGHTLPPGKTRYPFYRRLGGPQGRSGWAENLVPTGIRSWTVQPIVAIPTELPGPHKRQGM